MHMLPTSPALESLRGFISYTEQNNTILDFRVCSHLKVIAKGICQAGLFSNTRDNCFVCILCNNIIELCKNIPSNFSDLENSCS